MSDCCASKGSELEKLAQQADQRRVLIVVLILNALMFVAEFTAGIIAGSAALMADSVDMLGDASVYGLSLYAITRSGRWKAGAALAKGMFIMALGIGVDGHKAFLRKMGQLDRLRTELPESAEPIIPPRWGELNTITISFGHGIAVAPSGDAVADAWFSADEPTWRRKMEEQRRARGGRGGWPW